MRKRRMEIGVEAERREREGRGAAGLAGRGLSWSSSERGREAGAQGGEQLGLSEQDVLRNEGGEP